MKKNWAARNLDSVGKLAKIHNPRIFAKVFNQKVPMTFCANEDCVYKSQDSCPAGVGKDSCPNISSLDYKDGCPYYIGKPFQAPVLSDSMSGRFQIMTVITGRGTGKSSVLDTQKVVMEATTEPYVRAYLYRSLKPIPVKIIVVGNTKDTSLLLRQSIHNSFESNPDLYSFIIDDNKTYIKTSSGAEIFFKTAGVDGRGLRGFHADIMKNALKEDIKCTIIFIFDEGMYTRAPNVIGEVMRPSLQVGNTYSQIMVTSTPHGDKGEISDIRKNPSAIQSDHNFASYHNKFTNLQLLHDFRRKCAALGQATIYNTEVLGKEESDDSLFWPLAVWLLSLDDSLDWMDIEDIERIAKNSENLPLPGTYYCGVDPNKFRQLKAGDFAAYNLVQITSDRSRVRAISYGKFRMDLEGKFFKRLEYINKVFRPRFCADGNSGIGAKMKRKGFDVMNCSNNRHQMNPAMRWWKQDIIDGKYRQPPSQDWEDERQCFIPKEDGVSHLPILDHMGAWGSGYSSDLMRCGGYIYEGIMQDFGLEGAAEVYVESISPSKISVVKSGNTFDSILKSSSTRFKSVKR